MVQRSSGLPEDFPEAGGQAFSLDITMLFCIDIASTITMTLIVCRAIFFSYGCYDLSVFFLLPLL